MDTKKADTNPPAEAMVTFIHSGTIDSSGMCKRKFTGAYQIFLRKQVGGIILPHPMNKPLPHGVDTADAAQVRALTRAAYLQERTGAPEVSIEELQFFYAYVVAATKLVAAFRKRAMLNLPADIRTKAEAEGLTMLGLQPEQVQNQENTVVDILLLSNKTRSTVLALMRPDEKSLYTFPNIRIHPLDQTA